MIFRQLFDPESSTYTYLLADEETREALLIDPVRDQVERDAQLLEELDLRLVLTLETHVHADHITASGVLRTRLGSESVLSHAAGTGCASRSVRDGDVLQLGRYSLRVLETPGHTDGCVSYYEPTEGRVFTGDALLIRGCGRTDFQQGDPAKLYRSITEKLFVLPDAVRVFPGHDYRGQLESTIAEEKRFNPRLASRSEAEFVEIMRALKLKEPKKINEAVPANLACGVADVPMAAGPVGERAWAPIERVADGVPEVTVDWVAEHPAEARIIDVREADEYAGELGHIAGSELVPLATLHHSSEVWNREAPLVVVCRSGRRSATAALALERAGFRRVASMRGGMVQWRAANKPARPSAL